MNPFVSHQQKILYIVLGSNVQAMHLFSSTMDMLSTFGWLNEDVHSLNIRAQDNVQDLLLMTHERIHEVLDVARSKYDALASLSDAIALLDLCHGFADKVTLSKLPWSRPSIADEMGDSAANDFVRSGALMIRNGRYAIDVSESYLASAEGPQEIVPNDTYATGLKNFTVISGINGSGKSTYLKQVAIIVLLAHCGSYVPAEQASVPVSMSCVVLFRQTNMLTIAIASYKALCSHGNLGRSG